MPDARSPIRHYLVLYQRDPEQGRARFFSLMIERHLFGNIRLVRNWGAVGTRGQEKVDIFPAPYRVDTDERALSGVRLGLA
jgi:predicted DNA-binding WGR domain protein